MKVSNPFQHGGIMTANLSHSATEHILDRYKQAEKKDNDTMTMKFLLHKDKKEKGSPPHMQAHLALPDTKANASQSQKSLHFPNAQTDR